MGEYTLSLFCQSSAKFGECETYFQDNNYVTLEDFVADDEATDKFELEFELLRSSDLKRQYKAAKVAYEETLRAIESPSSESGYEGSSELRDDYTDGCHNQSCRDRLKSISNQVQSLSGRMDSLEKRQTSSDCNFQKQIAKLFPDTVRERILQEGDQMLAKDMGGTWIVTGKELTLATEPRDVGKPVRALFYKVFGKAIFSDYRYYTHLPDERGNPLKTAFDELLDLFAEYKDNNGSMTVSEARKMAKGYLDSSFKSRTQYKDKPMEKRAIDAAKQTVKRKSNANTGSKKKRTTARTLQSTEE